MKLRNVFIIIVFCLFGANAIPAGEKASKPRGYSIPLVDLAHETHRQIVVDREPGQYLGHPTTVLLEDNKTIIAVIRKATDAAPS